MRHPLFISLLALLLLFTLAGCASRPPPVALPLPLRAPALGAADAVAAATFSRQNLNPQKP